MAEQDLLVRPAAQPLTGLELEPSSLRGLAPTTGPRAGLGNAAQARLVATQPEAADAISAAPDLGMGNAAIERTVTAAVPGPPSDLAEHPPISKPDPAAKVKDAIAGEAGRAELKPLSSPEVPTKEPQPESPAASVEPVPEEKPRHDEAAEATESAGEAKERPPAERESLKPAADVVATEAVAAPSEEVSEEAAAEPTSAPTITATDPAGILTQLAQTPPSAALAAMNQAEQASAGALANQRQQAEQQLPEIDAPTGMPADAPSDVEPAPTARSEGSPPASEVPALEPAPAGTGEKSVDLSIPQIPPMPPPTPTVLPGPDTAATQAKFQAGARQALEGVDINAEAMPESLGPRPAVGMTGDADPTQMAAVRGTADAATAQAKAEAAQGIDADHGLGTIHPQPTDARLSAKRPLTGASAPPSTAGGPAASLPDGLSGGLDRALGPGLRERLGAKRDEYAAGQERFEADSAQAHRDSEADIARLTAGAAREQRTERRTASAEVTAQQQEWRKELDATEKDYLDKAGKAATQQRTEIDAKRTDGERRAGAEFDKAERKAAEETRKAEKKVQEEKAKKRKESGGFIGWVRSKAAALVDLLKKAINAIWDGLRSLVKGIFELAKKAAMIIIDAVRSVIVGLIKAYGTILKGIVSLTLIAFPGIAKRINAKIDKAVNIAVEKVNAVAEKLKSAVAAVLDFLASSIDKLLGLIQSLYNGLFTIIGMFIRGEFKELIERFGNVVAAARGAPSRFEAAAYEELLGGDFDQPLSPMELLQAGVTPPTLAERASGSGGQPVDQATPSPADAGELPRKPWSETNVAVDEVVSGAELSPEAEAESDELLASDGQHTIAQSDAPDRSLDAMMSEATAGGRDTGGDESQSSQSPQETKLPPDGLDPGGRAAIRWKLMKQGLAAWFEENKVAIIAGTVAALLALAALIFFSGGTILAAIPPIMAVLGPLFIGVTVATIAGHVQDFVTHGWEGRREAGSKSLAKAAASGAVELLSYLTFKAGGAALKGAKSIAKAGFKVTRRGAVAAGKFIAKGSMFTVSKGKVVLQGAKGFMTRQFKRLRELGEALLSRLRFKKIRLWIHGTNFELQGYINPWLLIMRGKFATELKQVAKGKKGAFKLDDEMVKKLTKPSKAGAIVRKLNKLGSDLLETRRKLGRFPANYRFAGEQVPLGKALAKKYPKGVRFNSKGFPVFPKEYRAAQVRFTKGFAGNHTTDFADAWKMLAKKNPKLAAKLKADNMHTWHHVEDGKTMQLIPWDLHDGVRHSGGVAVLKALAGK